MPTRTDRELLAAWREPGDEAAFAELVARHRQMVYRTSLRVLGNVHDSEDAVQAVFVVLAQKADRLRREGSLGGWLHTVTRHVARQALARRASHERRQKELALWHEATAAASAPDVDPGTVLRCLDQELAGLSAVLRQAVVLRYLQGNSEKAAAELAGCPLGTLSRRASAGLAKLRTRLARRGVALSGVALAGLLAAEAAAPVPETLLPAILATVKGAVTTSATAMSLTSTPALLAKGAMKAMVTTKLKLVAAIAAAVVATGSAVPVGIAVAHAAQKEAATAAAPQPPNVARVAVQVPSSTGEVRWVDAPELRVPYLKNPPTVDGVMSPGEWEDASALSAFFSDAGHGAFTNLAVHQIQPQVYAGYDSANLYFCFTSPIYPEGPLKAQCVYPDTLSHPQYGILPDDHLEIEIRPVEDLRRGLQRGLFRLDVNPIGTVADWYYSLSGGQDFRWNSGATIRSLADGKRWVVEYAIPLKSLRYGDYEAKDANGNPLVALPPSDGTTYRVWFACRMGDSFSAFDAHGWNTTKTKLILDSQSPAFQLNDLGPITDGKVDVQLTVKNHSPRPETVRIGFHVENANGPVYSTYQSADIPNGLVELRPGELRKLRLRHDSLKLTPDNNVLWFDVRRLGSPEKTLFRTRLTKFQRTAGGPTAQFDPERAKPATVVLRVGLGLTTTAQYVGGKQTAAGTSVRILDVFKNEGPEKLAKDKQLEILWDPRDKGLPAAECTVYLEAYRGENWKAGRYSYRFVGANAFAEQAMPGNSKAGISHVAVKVEDSSTAREAVPVPVSREGETGVDNADEEPHGKTDGEAR